MSTYSGCLPWVERGGRGLGVLQAFGDGREFAGIVKTVFSQLLVPLLRSHLQQKCTEN